MKEKQSENDQPWIEIRNWEKFQHYKKQTNPAWIKLYGSLHTDENYLQLKTSSRSLLIDLWLLAARTRNKVTASLKLLRLLLRCRIDPRALIELEKHGFIILHSRATLDKLYRPSRGTLPREEESRVDLESAVISEAALPPPLGEGGHTTALRPKVEKISKSRSEYRDANGWKISKRERDILEREKKRQSRLARDELEEEVFEPDYNPEPEPEPRGRLSSEQIEEMKREAFRRDEELRKIVSPPASAEDRGPPLEGPIPASSTWGEAQTW